mgnify:CR=1 FL=1|tara:strand:- start:350 stop:544 length:195 start_codon:yes stop_codon:yes gene_type:complete
MPGKGKAYDVNSFDEQNTEDAAGKKSKKRLPQPIRGVANWLHEEGAAAREDYKTLRDLKKNPKY